MNKYILLLTSSIISTFVHSNELYSFDNIELEGKLGTTKYGLTCNDCDNVKSYSIGLSTDKDYDIFFNSNFKINDSFSYNENENYNYDLDSYSLNANVNYNFIKKEYFNIYASGGLSYWNHKSIGQINSTVFSSTNRGISPVIGLGLNYKLNKNIKIGVEYNYNFEISNSESYINNFDANSLYLTFSYKLNPKEIIIQKSSVPDTKHIYEKEKITIKVKENYSIFFKLDNSELKEKNKIIEIANHINTYENPKDVIIYLMGHSSKTGAKEYNKILSQKRMEVVKKSLNEKLKKEYDIVFENYGDYYSYKGEQDQRVDVIIKSKNY